MESTSRTEAFDGKFASGTGSVVELVSAEPYVESSLPSLQTLSTIHATSCMCSEGQAKDSYSSVENMELAGPLSVPAFPIGRLGPHAVTTYNGVDAEDCRASSSGSCSGLVDMAS